MSNPYHKPAGFYKQPPVPVPVYKLTPQERFNLMFSKTHNTMNTVSAQFNGSSREYTYLTELDLKVGDICLTKAPKGWAAVTITAVPTKVPVDPNAKFEYKKLALPVSFQQTPAGIQALCADLVANSNTKENCVADLLAALNKTQP